VRDALVGGDRIVMQRSEGERDPAAAGALQLLLFELGSDSYALPIEGLLEVADMGELCCIPSVPPNIAGIVNHRGDALTVVQRSKLLGIGAPSGSGALQILVITDRVTAAARFGLPVDRVLGLVPGIAEMACGSDPVAERINVGGRVTSVLYPRRLVERARELIASSARGVE